MGTADSAWFVDLRFAHLFCLYRIVGVSQANKNVSCFAGCISCSRVCTARLVGLAFVQLGLPARRRCKLDLVSVLCAFCQRVRWLHQLSLRTLLSCLTTTAHSFCGLPVKYSVFCNIMYRPRQNHVYGYSSRPTRPVERTILDGLFTWYFRLVKAGPCLGGSRVIEVSLCGFKLHESQAPLSVTAPLSKRCSQIVLNGCRWGWGRSRGASHVGLCCRSCARYSSILGLSSQ